MTIYNPDPETIREEIFSVANNDNSDGLFLSNFYGKTLDGSDVAAYMESIGFEVIDFHDTGYCGLTTLANGVQISTNGCCLRSPSSWRVEISRNGLPCHYDVMARTRHDAECKAINEHLRKFNDYSEFKLIGTYEV